MITSDLPRVTISVKAYRQEKTVAEAVESVFAQTYPNLEILLSDDCSPDGTFEVMTDMAASYRGPHTVRLNRNPTNLGIVAHTNRIWELATGMLIVGCAGDDVAEPDKVARLVETWMQDPDHIVIVHSKTTVIDQDGNVLRERLPSARSIGDPSPLDMAHPHANGIGAATMYHRQRILDTFGPLSDVCMVEDGPLFFRAATIGRIAYVDASLVRYRIGGVSNPSPVSTARDYLFGIRVKSVAWSVATARAMLQDMEKVDFPEKAACRTLFRDHIAEDGFLADLFTGGTWRRIALVPEGLRRSIAARESRPLRLALQYALGPLYIAYHDWRHGRG